MPRPPTSTATSPIPPQATPPEFAFAAGLPHEVGAVDVVAVAVRRGAGPDDRAELDAAGVALSESVGDLLAAWPSTRAGEVTSVPLLDGSPRLVLLVGVGDGGTDDLRAAGAALTRAVLDQDVVATSIAADADDAGLTAFVEGMVLGAFTFTLASTGPDRRPVDRVVLAAGEARPDVLRRALAIAGASWWSRTLSQVPSNIKTPAWVADEARGIAEAYGLQIEVLEDERLRKDGFGGLTAVGRGSVNPPRLVRLTYTPEGVKRPRHVALVGKGITFDSGGLSIKPGQAMTNMKRDMTGAAVVLSVMGALAEVGCRDKVTGLLCLAENSVSGDAMRPGDVITHYGGRTTEVNNTDAEGRLVLADGLAYAVRDLQADVLVDIATLTGGIKVALGYRYGGLFSTDDAAAGHLLDAGRRAGEPLWPMPLADIYEDALESPVADAMNAPRIAQAIVAALFLRHFTGGLPWLHLDIASVGDSAGDNGVYTPGPTGFGARALLYWLSGS